MNSPKPLSNPTEIARETLRQLAVRRIAPNPDNYLAVYNEIAGIPNTPKASAAPLLEALRAAESKLKPAQEDVRQALKALDLAIQSGEWQKAADAVTRAADLPGRFERSWGDVVRELLRQWEVRHTGLNQQHKRDMLERVLINFGKDPVQLNAKLYGLARGWSENPIGAGVLDGSEVDAAPPGAVAGTAAVAGSGAAAGAAAAPGTALDAAVASTAPANQVAIAEWAELVAQIIEQAVVVRLDLYPDLQEDAKALVVRARESTNPKAMDSLRVLLKKFWVRLALQTESDQRLIQGLQQLLRLLVENIGELMADDQWMSGQVQVVDRLMGMQLDSRLLYEAETSIKQVILRQSNIKHSLTEAKATFKNMIATFVDRLGSISDSTGSYHDKLQDYSGRISQTDDIALLNTILGELMNDTRSMQVDMLRSREEMTQARQEAEAAEQRIRDLEAELQVVSDKVREDVLTGALNRRGMEEAFDREMARASRLESPLSVALLDLDNFKKLNDQLGHQAGDAALVHMIAVVKDVLRPMDQVARYGGEEFVIILPDTDTAAAVTVMQRVQRELTKRFFMHNNDRLLITFSCGVALLKKDEDQDSVIARADRAMYQAKQAGKNRVVAAD